MLSEKSSEKKAQRSSHKSLHLRASNTLGQLLVGLLFGTFVLAGCANGSLTALGGKTAEVPVCDADAPPLYRLSDPDTTLYLFGTVHLLRPELEWRSPTFDEAWRSADTAMFEANVESADAQARTVELVQEHGLYGPGESLYSSLDEAETELLLDTAESLGLPGPMLAQFKPWMAGLQISLAHMLQSGFTPGAGVESVLEKEARGTTKAVQYLETAEQQILMMSSLPAADQHDMLIATLTTLRDEPQGLDQMIDHWVRGDQAELIKAFVDVEALGSREVYDAMIVRRNQDWIPKIVALLEEPGVKFIAVGAGHLVGDDSVLKMLLAQGYTPSCV